ncbi:hypothetical protein [Paenisporosarcina sp. TG20]|uniref:hypothetical protein n=1 Tax=Paenisporosarcina sp. TG20 TaxID=1211706 RepID=UPI00031338C3|nr:hypothetical protein [Paenisporosarcina sp. TG20]
MLHKITLIICSILMALFIFMPGIAHQGAQLGLEVFSKRLLPYLLPYLVVSQWLLYELYKKNKWQTHVGNSMKIYAIGAFGGFPTGAATISTLAQSSMINKRHASHLLGICHAPNPMFVVGVVGSQFLSSVSTGMVLMVIIHSINLLFLIILHIFIPMPTISKNEQLTNSNTSSFSEGIHQTASILLLVATTMVFFTTISTVIRESIVYIFDAIPNQITVFIYSFFEMTAGLEIAHQLFQAEALFPLLAVSILSFNGLSIHMQIMVLAKSAKLSLKPYVLYRLIHFLLFVGISSLFL